MIKVIKANYVSDYVIHFTFNTGEEKSINFESELWGEIFEPLKNINYFKNFKLNNYTIEWENGADFAPEFLYQNVPIVI